MLTVLSLQEAKSCLIRSFPFRAEEEYVPLLESRDRVLSAPVRASSDVPAFSRSSVDGYAVSASDTFGCSASLPALFDLAGEVRMGSLPGFSLRSGECAYVPPGGALPGGSDAVVMIEQTESYAGGTVAVSSPVAPGKNVIFSGDDIRAGTELLGAGIRIRSREIGVLSAMGIREVPVRRRLRVAVFSTGNELIPADQVPFPGQIRDINGPMLVSMCEKLGADTAFGGILPDTESVFSEAVCGALDHSDLVLLSGGSSAGKADLTETLMRKTGTLLFHGISVKPGKPTLAADIHGKPVIGLPGHPVASYFVFLLLVRELIASMTGETAVRRTQECVLSQAVPSNHGREELVPVRILGGTAYPVISKSALISVLAGTDGYLSIPAGTEGLSAGQQVSITLWEDL